MMSASRGSTPTGSTRPRSHRRRRVRAWIGLVTLTFLLTAGCTSSKQGGPGDPVSTLEEAAGDAAHEGQVDAAAETLERALRLEPANATLWHRLARVRLQEGRPGQAESLARKSLSLAPGDDDLRRANWELIARSRDARGDVEGAEKARQSAR